MEGKGKGGVYEEETERGMNGKEGVGKGENWKTGKRMDCIGGKANEGKLKPSSNG